MESGIKEEEDEYGSSAYEENSINGNSKNPSLQPLTLVTTGVCNLVAPDSCVTDCCFSGETKIENGLDSKSIKGIKENQPRESEASIGIAFK
ncbi:hypothetical protein U1Q18_034403, partial [Sarracenia purpurea var. burkii]